MLHRLAFRVPNDGFFLNPISMRVVPIFDGRLIEYLPECIVVNLAGRLAVFVEGIGATNIAGIRFLDHLNQVAMSIALLISMALRRRRVDVHALVHENSQRLSLPL